MLVTLVVASICPVLYCKTTRAVLHTMHTRAPYLYDGRWLSTYIYNTQALLIISTHRIGYCGRFGCERAGAVSSIWQNAASCLLTLGVLGCRPYLMIGSNLISMSGVTL